MAYTITEKRMRTPYIWHLDEVNLEFMEIKVKVWQGLNTAVPSTFDYSFKKAAINNKVSLDIAQVVKSLMTLTIDSDEWSWLQVTRIKTVSGSDTTVTILYLVNLGFDYFSDGFAFAKNKVFLTDAPTLYIPDRAAIEVTTNSQAYSLGTSGDLIVSYIRNSVTSELTKITAEGTDTDDIIVKPTTALDGDYDGIIEAARGTVLDSIKIKVVDCSFQTPYRITFVNAHGVREVLWFFGKSVKRDVIKGDKFKRSILEHNTYSLGNSATPMMDVNGSTQITLNTGFIEEGMDEVIQQLMLSELCWLGASGSEIAVNVLSRNMEFKTVKNNRLINYTVTFEQTAQIINNIR